jgi:hypothetical protein
MTLKMVIAPLTLKLPPSCLFTRNPMFRAW